MTPHEREVMQQALVALEKYEQHTRGVMIPSTRNRGDSVIEALRACLAQHEKEWVGLTEAERLEIIAVGGEAAVLYVTEAKLREKNSG